MTADMFPRQPDEQLRSWNHHMREWSYCWIKTQRERPTTPDVWCTACQVAWQRRGWWCYLCFGSSMIGIFLAADSPCGYKHYDVRRVCRFLELPQCSDVYVRTSDRSWQYKELIQPMYCSGPRHRRLRVQMQQDYTAREWLAEVRTLLMSEFHPLPGEHINAPGPLASQRLLSWLLYLRPFLLMTVYVPLPPPV